MPTATKVNWISQIGNLPVIDVRAYGALCDGTTDDTTAVQAAIAAAQGMVASTFYGAGVVMFPPCTCVVGALTVTGPVTLRGAGMQATRLLRKSSVTTGTLIACSMPTTPGDFARPYGLEIAYLTIDLNGNGAMKAIQLTNCNHNTDIHDLFIRDGAYGIYLNGGCDFAEINHCTLWDQRTDSIFVLEEFGYATATGSSSTSVAIATSFPTTVTLTTGSGLGYVVGSRVRVQNDATHFMDGVVTSYSGTTLQVSIDTNVGTGTFSSWSIGEVIAGGEVHIRNNRIFHLDSSFTAQSNIHVSRTTGADNGGVYIEFNRCNNSGNIAGYSATSTSSFTIGSGSAVVSGSLTVTTQTGLAYVSGQNARIFSGANAQNFVEGTVSSYSGSSLTITVTRVNGSGTHADWNIGLHTITSYGLYVEKGSSGGASTFVHALGNIFDAVDTYPIYLYHAADVELTQNWASGNGTTAVMIDTAVHIQLEGNRMGVSLPGACVALRTAPSHLHFISNKYFGPTTSYFYDIDTGAPPVAWTIQGDYPHLESSSTVPIASAQKAAFIAALGNGSDLTYDPVYSPLKPQVTGHAGFVWAYDNATQSITTSNSWQDLTWDTNHQASGPALHSTSVNPTQFVAYEDGDYELSGVVTFAVNGTGLRGARILINGAGYFFVQIPAVTGDSTGVALPRVRIQLSSGDVIKVQAIQTSGGALSTASIVTFFQMQRVY